MDLFFIQLAVFLWINCADAHEGFVLCLWDLKWRMEIEFLYKSTEVLSFIFKPMFTRVSAHPATLNVIFSNLVQLAYMLHKIYGTVDWIVIK